MNNKFFEEFSKLGQSAFNSFAEFGKEIEAQIKAVVENRLAAMNMVRRDEFEALKESLQKAHEEIQELKNKSKKKTKDE
jgi:BMFP domain-containing protein YqiC